VWGTVSMTRLSACATCCEKDGLALFRREPLDPETVSYRCSACLCHQAAFSIAASTDGVDIDVALA
jgi:hypothetical protein